QGLVSRAIRDRPALARDRLPRLARARALYLISTSAYVALSSCRASISPQRTASTLPSALRALTTRQAHAAWSAPSTITAQPVPTRRNVALALSGSEPSSPISARRALVASRSAALRAFEPTT